MPKRDRLLLLGMAASVALFLGYEGLFAGKTGLPPPQAELTDLTVTRLLGGAAFLLLVRYMEFPLFGLRTDRASFLRTLPFWLVACNNLPVLSLLTGDAVLTDACNAGNLLLLGAECLAIALFEESAFRGILLLLLLRRFGETRGGRIRSLILSSVIFGAVHLANLFSSSPPAVLLQVGYSTLIGGMCGIALLLCGRLWVPIALHAVYDFGGQLVDTVGKGTVWTVPEIVLTAVVGTAVAGYALFVLFGMDRAHTFFDSENRAASAARQ